MKKKYVLYVDSKEVKRVKDIYQGCVLDQEGSSNPEEIKLFDNVKEALNEIKNYETTVRDFERYYLVEEYFIAEDIYDENGKLEYSGDIYGYSELPDKYSKFHINEKSESAYSRKKYTFDEVKEFFKLVEDAELNDDEYNGICRQNEEIDSCYNLDELINVLTKQAGGMEFTYIIEKC